MICLFKNITYNRTIGKCRYDYIKSSAFFICNKMKSVFIITTVLSVLLIACRDYTPKPVGYNRLEFPAGDLKKHSFNRFSLEYPSYAELIAVLKKDNKDEEWFSITYPEYNVEIYCTYLPITKRDLSGAIDDSYKMAYSHVVKASEIEQLKYIDNENRVSGILYHIEGDVATPLQFFVTDSISHFLRGSFYYNRKVNSDSVAPLTEFVINDIKKMIGSIRWVDSK